MSYVCYAVPLLLRVYLVVRVSTVRCGMRVFKKVLLHLCFIVHCPLVSVCHPGLLRLPARGACVLWDAFCVSPCVLHVCVYRCVCVINVSSCCVCGRLSLFCVGVRLCVRVCSALFVEVCLCLSWCS